ncbi:MAG: hypothetical protein RIB98_02565 [Acidimicrobiales bacterium]
MLTELAATPSSTVAASVAAAEEIRRRRCDATAMVERLAGRAHTAGLDHPVAAALALAARMSRLCGPEEFAAAAGLSSAEVVAAEAGAVPFGSLPRAYDALFAAMGVDLLSLADLARTLH